MIKTIIFVATSWYILFLRLNILHKTSDHFVIENIWSKSTVGVNKKIQFGFLDNKEMIY